jgi:hypothetical protein
VVNRLFVNHISVQSSFLSSYTQSIVKYKLRIVKSNQARGCLVGLAVGFTRCRQLAGSRASTSTGQVNFQGVLTAIRVFLKSESVAIVYRGNQPSGTQSQQKAVPDDRTWN